MAQWYINNDVNNVQLCMQFMSKCLAVNIQYIPYVVYIIRMHKH